MRGPEDYQEEETREQVRKKDERTLDKRRLQIKRRTLDKSITGDAFCKKKKRGPVEETGIQRC